MEDVLSTWKRARLNSGTIYSLCPHIPTSNPYEVHWLQIRYKSDFKNILVRCLPRLLVLTMKLKDTILSLLTDLSWDTHPWAPEFQLQKVVWHCSEANMDLIDLLTLGFSPSTCLLWKKSSPCGKKKDIFLTICHLLSPGYPFCFVLFCILLFDPHKKFYF